MLRRGRLEGVMVALATPLNADETVHEAGLRQLLRRVLAGGVHGVVVLGTAGEFAALADAQKQRAIEIAVDEVAGRISVVAGTGESSTRRALATTRMAAQAGADAAIIVPPYYYRVDQAAVLAHYRTLAAEGGLPVMLYNIPGFTKVTLDLDTVRKLAAEPGIVGLKDSGGDFGYFQRVVTECKSEHFTVVTGSDNLFFASLAVRGDGNISPGANLVPGWFVALWDAMHAARWDEAQALQDRISALGGGIHRYSNFPAGLKAALSLLGIGANVITAPTLPYTPEQTAQVATALKQFGLL